MTMTLNDVKKKVDALVEEGHGSVPVLLGTSDNEAFGVESVRLVDDYEDFENDKAPQSVVFIEGNIR